MKSRETLIRLKKFQVDEKRRKVAQIEAMIAEFDRIAGDLEREIHALDAGERMQSMMAPTVVVDGDGLVLAAGSAGGSRLRSALVQVLAGILDEGLEPARAVEAPRLHPAGGVVHAEPGFPEEVYAALADNGYEVRRWPAQHHYFGGTSVVARSGAAADPRRSGLAVGLG